uniref:NADH dehydrogenase subunit 5 n=1 Tax=Malacocephalus laevis TaxID=630738 RepID=UPI0028FC8B87|nr:NADH dehydrogenase subunit 5 [Malacocephalus laevis]WNH37766.1 NADH dehydrogenase subunit 5 [Malacocephalus laevis]
MEFQTIIFTSSLMVILTVLALPLFTSFLLPSSPRNFSLHTKKAVKTAFIISLIPLFIFIYSGEETVLSSPTWTPLPTLSISVSFMFNAYSTIFISVALYVTWAILEFALWYMESDPKINQFYKALLVFLISMLILVTANNLFQLFIGWEGVGIMSFLLISWWHGRIEANTAALQAILYNRAADIGMLFALAWFAIKLGSWDLQELLATEKSMHTLPPLLALVLAAAGKSAQAGFHPWLPAAMEGPTPVSALLHSSTMVVAGIFLLIRFNPLMQNEPRVFTLCLCLGALTTFFTAFCALTQNDIKKIVAFSTSSQLGLMMVSIGLNQPMLTFFHICTHAFFKAMLFLSSGSVIHALNGEQDIRKMGGLYRPLPLTSTCFTLGSLALMGAPFLSGFYSKDAIVEALHVSAPNAWALALTLIAIMMTAVYSLRIIFFVIMGSPRFPSLLPINENVPSVVNPLKRLLWGSIFSGFILILNVSPMKTQITTMAPHLKLTALLITIAGLLAALGLASLTAKLKPQPEKSPRHFSNLLGFFPLTMHRLHSKISLHFGQTIANQAIDQTWLHKIGPKFIPEVTVPSSSSISNLQQGMIKIYLLTYLTTLLTTLVIFSLFSL